MEIEYIIHIKIPSNESNIIFCGKEFGEDIIHITSQTWYVKLETSCAILIDTYYRFKMFRLEKIRIIMKLPIML